MNYAATYINPPDPSAVAAFNKIYKGCSWGACPPNTDTSKSGKGSSIAITGNARKILEYVFEKYEIKTFLDAPCGDFHWQPHIKGINSIYYTGIDIVCDNIQELNMKNLGDFKKKFLCVDMANTRLPNNTYDLVLVRHVIQHMNWASGINFLKAFEDAGVKYLLSSTWYTHQEMHPNSDGQHLAQGSFFDNVFFFLFPSSSLLFLMYFFFFWRGCRI